MAFLQPVWQTDELAGVRGNAWSADGISAVITDFVQQFLFRFPGKETSAIRGGFVARVGLVLPPDPITDAGEFLTILADLLRESLQISAPLDDIRIVIESGDYQCRLSLIDEIPHFHPTTGEFHRSSGAAYPYEVQNAPTIQLFPRASGKHFFRTDDDTAEIRSFLAAIASKIGFAVNGGAGSPFFELTPDRRAFAALRRQMQMYYVARDPADRCVQNLADGEPQDATSIGDRQIDFDDLLDP